MNRITENLNTKGSLLMEARKKLHSLHKLLVVEEGYRFERINGQIINVQFLNLLVNDRNFQWLRKIFELNCRDR